MPGHVVSSTTGDSARDRPLTLGQTALAEHTTETSSTAPGSPTNRMRRTSRPYLRADADSLVLWLARFRAFAAGTTGAAATTGCWDKARPQRTRLLAFVRCCPRSSGRHVGNDRGARATVGCRSVCAACLQRRFDRSQLRAEGGDQGSDGPRDSRAVRARGGIYDHITLGPAPHDGHDGRCVRRGRSARTLAAEEPASVSTSSGRFCLVRGSVERLSGERLPAAACYARPWLRGR